MAIAPLLPDGHSAPVSESPYDFLVLGGGSAGYNAANLARQHLDRVAIVDGSPELGGLCILRGCMPSKTLIYSAEVLHLAQQGSRFGLHIPTAEVDMAALHRRKREVIGEFAEYRQEQLLSEKFDLYRQHGALLPDGRVALADGTILTAERILLSTGSRIAVPPVPGLADTPFWTSDDILDLAEVPSSVIVLGGGVVACELAQYLRRIGSEVVQIQRSGRILKDLAPDLSAVAEQAFRDEGIELFTGTALESVESLDGGSRVRVRFRHGGETVEREASHLFNALGRQPATDDLGLPEAGIEILPSGHIATDEHQQTTRPGVYAAGDCAGPHEIVHVAILQGEHAVRHSLGLPSQPPDYDKLLWVVFTDPQLAAVGPPVEALEERFGSDLLVEDFPFDDHGRSILMEAKYGYVRVYADRASGRVLRAECAGKDGGELIHAMSVAVGLGATVEDLLGVHWYHPTLAEIWTYPLEDLADARAGR